MHLTRTLRGSWLRLGMAAVAAGLLCGAAWRADGAGAATEGAAAPARGASIAITAVDYAFAGVPERVAVGTTFTLVNVSAVELHELVAIRIADSEPRSVAELIQLSDDELVGVIADAPAMVLIALPEAAGVAVVGDGAFTEPGRYALVCFIPTGADPQAYLAAAAQMEGPPQVPGGPPHVVLGMFAEVIVE